MPYTNKQKIFVHSKIAEISCSLQMSIFRSCHYLHYTTVANNTECIGNLCYSSPHSTHLKVASKCYLVTYLYIKENMATIPNHYIAFSSALSENLEMSQNIVY